MNNRQSGSQLPIPVTPKVPTHTTTTTPVPMAPTLPYLLDGAFPTPPRQKRRSRDRLSGLFSAAKTRTSPIWRPSTAHTPPTPQWPLPRVPITIRDENPALTKTYTRPRDAPLPPPPSSSTSSSSSSCTSDNSTTNEAAAAAAAPLLQHHPRSPRSPASPPRPPYFPQPNHHQRHASFQTRYMNLALSIDKIPRSHNILANLFAWMVLVAFVLAPGNFSSSSSSQEKLTTTTAHPPSTPLLGICLALFALGILGHTWLRWVHRRNYIWLLNRIYLPLVLHSLAGVLATLVLVDVQHGWAWSTTACVTVAVEGATLVFSAAMFLFLDLVLLRKLRAEHVRETTSRKNVVDLVKAGKRPPFAPGSVV